MIIIILYCAKYLKYACCKYTLSTSNILVWICIAISLKIMIKIADNSSIPILMIEHQAKNTIIFSMVVIFASFYKVLEMTYSRHKITLVPYAQASYSSSVPLSFLHLWLFVLPHCLQDPIDPRKHQYLHEQCRHLLWHQKLQVF